MPAKQPRQSRLPRKMARSLYQWTPKLIVAMCFQILVLLVATLDWALFFLAFLYCLIKAFQKAKDTTTRAMILIIGAVYTAARITYLPAMVVTVALPRPMRQYFSPSVVTFCYWYTLSAYCVLYTLPTLFMVFQKFVTKLGGEKSLKVCQDETTAPKVMVVMPVYKELPGVLLKAIDSVVGSIYPQACLHLFPSFDGDEEDELLYTTLASLGVPKVSGNIPRHIDVKYRECRVTMSRFPHGGKRNCQKQTFKLIETMYTDYFKHNDDAFILFIDSDCILRPSCIQKFMDAMEKHDKLAMTGIITATTGKRTLLTLLQDIEYVQGQFMERAIESACGAVTCLPGALTMLRYSAFRRMAKFYFADKAGQCEDLYDFARFHLGEDRFLTHLFMVGAEGPYRIGLCTEAFCKTEAVQTYSSLLKQRRRWFLGYLANEIPMLTDINLWKKYPILLMWRLLQNSLQSTPLILITMVIAIVTGITPIGDIPIEFILLNLCTTWLFMADVAWSIRRWKALLYPISFVLMPVQNCIIRIYAVLTASQRTWGGPRADAAAADESKTAQEAILEAEEAGDDLNVIPETFKTATETRTQTIHMQPSDIEEGRFARPSLEDGVYQQDSITSMLTLSDPAPAHLYPSSPVSVQYSTETSDSFHTDDSEDSRHLHSQGSTVEEAASNSVAAIESPTRTPGSSIHGQSRPASYQVNTDCFRAHTPSRPHATGTGSDRWTYNSSTAGHVFNENVDNPFQDPPSPGAATLGHASSIHLLSTAPLIPLLPEQAVPVNSPARSSSVWSRSKEISKSLFKHLTTGRPRSRSNEDMDIELQSQGMLGSASGSQGASPKDKQNKGVGRLFRRRANSTSSN